MVVRDHVGINVLPTLESFCMRYNLVGVNVSECIKCAANSPELGEEI